MISGAQMIIPFRTYFSWILTLSQTYNEQIHIVTKEQEKKSDKNSGRQRNKNPKESQQKESQQNNKIDNNDDSGAFLTIDALGNIH